MFLRAALAHTPYTQKIAEFLGQGSEISRPLTLHVRNSIDGPIDVYNVKKHAAQMPIRS